MNDNEFELGLEKLNREERKKQQYYLESFEQGRRTIASIFNDHYTALSEFKDGVSVEDIVSFHELRTDDSQEEENSLAKNLSTLINKDIEQSPDLISGEIHVSGEGMYMHSTSGSSSEHQDREFALLEEGDALIGDIKYYSVAPIVSYEIYRHIQEGGDISDNDVDDKPPVVLGVWIHITNATVQRREGCKEELIDEVFMPLEYPSLQFDKVIRHEDSVVQEKPIEMHIPVLVHFKNEFINEVCNNFENDLNYNEYTSEEHHALRAEYQSELDVYMGMVDRDEELVVSTHDAIMLMGGTKEFINQTAVYSAPIIISIRDTWRVVHAFEVQTTDGVDVAHVLPEHVIDITSQNKE